MSKNNFKRPEVLAPAGTLEILKVAVDYGADAVFVGGQQYGLRSRAGNFSMEELQEGINYAHARGAQADVDELPFQPRHNLGVLACCDLIPRDK